MYALLRAAFPRRLADWLMAVWYAILILLVLYCAFEPNADFNYLML